MRRIVSRCGAVAALAVAPVLVVGCGADGGSGDGTRGGDDSREVVASGFDGPTQLAPGPGGVVLVAQLGGPEDAAMGEIVVLDPGSGARRTLLDGLDKPTGVAYLDGAVWVMVQRGLLRARWPGGETPAGPAEVVLDDLPFNGRSEGTLTPLADGRLLYETSGNLVAGRVEEGSGILWVLDPETLRSSSVASGAKHAYAHALLDDGRLAVTEIGDNIADPPVEELNVVPPPTGEVAVDLGWPSCPGDLVCAGVVGPASVFEPRATPTGVVVVDGQAYVALFVPGTVVRVDLRGWTAGDPPRTPEVVAAGLDGPHSLLARPDGSLWLTEHGSGTLLALRPTG